ncbi:MAG: TIGR04376 family protein, partial [Coleofasciculaceae cyanobacterium]
MGLFEDLNRFLENRLEEFLRNNPHLELQALEEQLREQEEDTLRLLAQLGQQEKHLQDEILAIAKEIQVWHARVGKARNHNREDLAKAAQMREAALLRQGNQRWGQMEGVKQRIAKTRELQRQIQQRRQEVRAKAAQENVTRASSQSNSTSDTSGWNQTSNQNLYSNQDPLAEQ